MRDTHQMVVHDIGKVVGRHAVCFQEYLVVQFAALKNDVAPDQVLHVYVHAGFHFQANDVGLLRFDAAANLGSRHIQAVFQVSAGPEIIGEIFGRGAGCFERFGRIESVIGMAAFH